MEILRRRSINVAIIERSGERTILKPTRVEQASIEEFIKEAMDRSAEIRWYYIPCSSLEIIRTALPPKYEQPWHSHKSIHEATLVLEGHVLVLSMKDETIKEVDLAPGDLVVLDTNPEIYHTMKNTTKKYATTMTLKYVGPEKKDEKLFQKDWHPRFAQDLERAPPEHDVLGGKSAGMHLMNRKVWLTWKFW